MLVIKSFLKKPNTPIYDLEDANRNPSHFFVDIDDTATIAKIKDQFDRDYLAGALIIKYNERTILNFRHYDLIDQLLAYFLNMLDELQTHDISRYSFPDQPLEITINRINKNIFHIS